MAKVQFSTPGDNVWHVPVGIHSIFVARMRGPGQGGGRQETRGGPSGHAGWYVEKKAIPVTEDTDIIVHVGGVGLGGVFGDNIGKSESDTWVVDPSVALAPAGAVSPSTPIGDVIYEGGKSSTTVPGHFGGAGGAASPAPPPTVGVAQQGGTTTGSPGVAAPLGFAGAKGGDDGVAGDDATEYGGAGGGGGRAANGGNGMSGFVELEY